jgi:hypothetical protein
MAGIPGLTYNSGPALQPFTAPVQNIPLQQDYASGGLVYNSGPLAPDPYSAGGGGGGGYADGSSYGGGSVSAPAPVIDQAAIASYNQAIGNTQSAVNRLPAQLQSGYGSIDASYQNALNQLLLSKNQGQSAYDTTKHQTASDYVASKNTIGANAGSLLSGLYRLLGAHGAGGGSAYNISAPGAVGREATAQRQAVGQTFGANNQALDTNWGNFMTDYNNQVSGAGSQKDQQRQSLEQNINTNKASLLQTLAQLTAQRDIAAGGGPSAAQPYINQANALLDQTANYQTSPINYQTSAYQAPNLANYTSSKVTPTYQGAAPQNDYFSPYLGALLGKKQQPLAA